MSQKVSVWGRRVRSPRPWHVLLVAALLVAGFDGRAQTGGNLTPGRLVNLSARANLASAGDGLTVGFALSGTAGESLLIRGIGPTLGTFGVPAPIPDPTLTVFSGGNPVAQNDDWSAGGSAPPLAAAAAGVGAFALPTGSRDAAVLTRMASGTYTARVADKAGGTGDVLVEFYDAGTDSTANLANLSALARVGGTSGLLTVGFVIDGQLPRRVLLRGVGPALTPLGVTGALADPQLTLRRQGDPAVLQQNDNWGGSDVLKAAFAAGGAFAFPSDSSRDAALIATLPPGAYTVQLSANGTATGLALVEIYDVTPPTIAVPTIALPPRSLTLAPGAYASLTVIPGDGAPAAFQWSKDGSAIAGATTDTLLIPNAAVADAGSYRVTIANAAGAITSAPATVTVSAPAAALPTATTFDLVGFATLAGGTTGGGVLASSDPNYHVLDAATPNKAQQLRTWLESTTAMVIDIQADVDLGALNNVSARPKTNPELIASGVGVINVRSNKTLFSSTGATLRHGTLNISGQNNIIVRNLRFRGLWEFDEGSQDPPNNAPWGYKIQDWDYIDVQNGARNVWIDHCDFEKSYDGILDTKQAADLATYSWCRLGGDTEGAVERQIAYLEKLYRGQLTDSRVTSTFYRGLRDGAYASQGIAKQSVADIVAHELPHDKCNLVGAGDTETQSIGYLNLTLHHIYYHDCRQRLPRMRFGNAHVFNLYVDNSHIVDGTNMATATTCDAAIFAENNQYVEVADPFPAVSGTSPPGRVTQTGCRWILRGVAQSFAGNTFLQNPATWTWNTATKNFSWSAAPAPNAAALPYSYRADTVDFMPASLGSVGVIVPRTAADQATLAGYLLRTAH